MIAALLRVELREEVSERLRGGESGESISDWFEKAPPPDSGAIPSFGESVGTEGNLTALASFGGAGGSSFTPMVRRGETVSPVTRGISHPEAIGWATESPRQSPGASLVDKVDKGKVPDGPRSRGWGQVLSLEMPEMKPPVGTWTNLTADMYFVQHLLALYFCWEYPAFASLSREHFMKDFHDIRQRYCSSILVNAILALGCRFSTQPNTRATPDDPYTSGDHFFKECRRLFYQEENHHSLTTIQALGIMSIREASCGRDSESWYYAGQSIRLAVEMGLHQIGNAGSDEDEATVQAVTFWGAFALDQ